MEEALMKKYGPLPAWGWMALAAGGLFLYMRMRTGSSSSSTGASGSDQQGQGLDSQGQAYGSGYDTGVQAGYQLGANSVYQKPPKGSQYCRSLKAPNGHRYRVCGLGHWVEEGKGHYRWAHGPAPDHDRKRDRDPRRDRDTHRRYPVPTGRRTVRVP